MEGIKGKIKCEFKDIAALLRDLPDKFVVKDVKHVQKQQWQRVADAAARIVPVDTGRLKEMIIANAGYSKKKGIVFANAGLRKIKKKERIKIQARKAAGKVGKTALEYDAYYGAFIEFGTRKMHAQPFMRPAFDENFRAILDSYASELKTRLENRLAKLQNAPKRSL